jgi:hypothetical protein
MFVIEMMSSQIFCDRNDGIASFCDRNDVITNFVIE